MDALIDGKMSYMKSRLKFFTNPITRTAHRNYFLHKDKIAFDGKIKNYRRNITFKFKCEDFVVKTVEKSWELMNAFNLRHEVFLSKDNEKMSFNRYDIDAFDSICDHIVVVYKPLHLVVATYRVLPSAKTNDFYSATEFHINDFLLDKSRKLEIGRACIKKGFRNTMVINLLWRGVSEYIMNYEPRYIFGVSSIHTECPIVSKRIYNYLISKYSDDKYKIVPRNEFSQDYKNIPDPLLPLTRGEQRDHIPPLLRTYLSMGAKVYGFPALDKVFKCIDFFTIIDMYKIKKAFKLRFMAKDVN